MAKLLRLEQGIGVVLPREVLAALGVGEGDELELSIAKPGIVVLTKAEARPKGEPPARPPQPLSAEELSLLRKLDAIRFADRVPLEVNKGLTVGERKLLDGLIKKRVVTIYKGGRYARGVYNIPREYYPLVKKAREAGPSAQPAVQPRLPQQLPRPPSSAASPPPPLSSLQHLERFGFMIVSSEAEAKSISAQLEKRIKAGEILGTRGFDRKFYVATRGLFLKLGGAVRGILKGGDKSVAEIARSLGCSEDAARTVLELLNEQGDVIEKRRGIYRLS
ncbi:MAG: AbrB/MazE/SpoVT family DNA-binding domain-containing protein [Candidatus Micrarchaeia archaeon]